MTIISPARLFGFIRPLMVVLFAAFLSVTFAHAAPPSDQAAKDYVKGVADKAFGILQTEGLSQEQRKQNLRILMKQEVALDYIGKLSLGRFNRAPTDVSPADAARFKDQITEYRRIFPDFAFDKMYNLVLKDLNKSSVEVTGVTPIRETDVFVNSKILRQGKEPIITDWRVRTDANGKLKIIDVVAEGISLTITQRDDFATLISEGGMDKLLASMHGIMSGNGTTASTAPAKKTP
jgi:phospholipid transport system substrate-binding protein